MRISVLLFALLLAGCQVHSDQDCQELKRRYQELQQRYDQISKDHTRITNAVLQHQLDNARNEAILETALACNALPINLCPAGWTNINIESFQKAGFIGQPTWRYWLILCGGLLERLVILMMVLYGFLFVWKTISAPDTDAVSEAKDTIAMAKEAQTKLDRRISALSAEETQLLANLRQNIASAKKELFTLSQELAEQKTGYVQWIDEEQAKVDQLRVEISALEQQKRLFGG